MSRWHLNTPGVGLYEPTRDAIRESYQLSALILPGKNASEMRAELNRWFAFYGATSPAILWLIRMAYQDTVKLRVIHRCADATRRAAITLAQDEWDRAQEQKIWKQTKVLALAPADAVRELESFAAGCRWLINRWQRLKGRLERYETLQGGDREEAIRLQGAIPALERLRESDAGLLTWGCCLFAQLQPNQERIAAFDAAVVKSLTLRGIAPSQASRQRLQCRQWLLARIEREVARLRQCEEQLWSEQEQPARTALIEQELATAEGKLRKLTRYEKEAEKSLKRNLAAVARECKRTGIVLPIGSPYKTSKAGPRSSKSTFSTIQ